MKEVIAWFSLKEFGELKHGKEYLLKHKHGSVFVGEYYATTKEFYTDREFVYIDEIALISELPTGNETPANEINQIGLDLFLKRYKKFDGRKLIDAIKRSYENGNGSTN